MPRSTPSLLRRTLLLLVTSSALTPPLAATEGGATAFPNGAEDFLTASMPPPGGYGWLQWTQYSAERFAGPDGHAALPHFSLQVDALALRYDWVKPASILGADRWGTLFVLPLLDLDLALSPAPNVALHDRRRGAGDFTIGNGLHWQRGNFEWIHSFDAAMPTGVYDVRRLANPGQNKWTFRLNTLGTWRPAPGWDVSYRFHWDYNFANHATDYRSGQTLYLNWGVGWNPRPPLTIGLVGYHLRQITDDVQAGRAIGQRLRVDGLGPGVKYLLPNHVMLTAKYFWEFGARNHPEGLQLWLEVTVPFGGPPK